jgi:hypothetical protein
MREDGDKCDSSSTGKCRLSLRLVDGLRLGGDAFKLRLDPLSMDTTMVLPLISKCVADDGPVLVESHVEAHFHRDSGSDQADVTTREAGCWR